MASEKQTGCPDENRGRQVQPYSEKNVRRVRAEPVRWRTEKKTGKDQKSGTPTYRGQPARSRSSTPASFLWRFSLNFNIQRFLWKAGHNRGNGSELMGFAAARTDLGCPHLIKQIWYLQPDVWTVPVVHGDCKLQSTLTTCWVYSEFRLKNHK